jgi:hypothetical protein
MKSKPRIIKCIKTLTTSKRDLYGNVYGFITVTNTKTGETIEALVDSPGNEDVILSKIGLKYENAVYNTVQLPIREFNREAKGLPWDYVPMLFKLFHKSYKAYLAQKKAEEKKRDDYYKKIRAIREKEWKKEERKKAKLEKE